MSTVRVISSNDMSVGGGRKGSFAAESADPGFSFIFLFFLLLRMDGHYPSR